MGEAAQDPELVDYLAEANVEFDRLDEQVPLVAKLAQFPQITFGHVLMPRASITWPRDKASLERAVVILVKQGRVSVDSEADTVSREPGLHLVPPAVDPVRVRALDGANEFIYISVNAALIADIPVPSGLSTPLSPFSTAILAPLVTFVTTLCTISAEPGGNTAPLVSAAVEAVRSIVRVATDADNVPASIFDRAMQIIVRDYASRELTVPALATTLEISRRTLQSAFAREGTTVSDELRGVRTRAALKARASDQALSAGEIAFVAGFGSESAMFRALHKHALLDSSIAAAPSAASPSASSP